MSFLKEHVTDEQILDMALEIQSLREYDLEGDSGMVITLYCIEQLTKTQKGFTQDELESKIKEIISGHLLKGMVDRGVLDPVFDDDGLHYEATPMAKKWLQDNP